jgi:hypothetical protein
MKLLPDRVASLEEQLGKARKDLQTVRAERRVALKALAREIEHMLETLKSPRHRPGKRTRASRDDGNEPS